MGNRAAQEDAGSARNIPEFKLTSCSALTLVQIYCVRVAGI